VVVRSNTHTPTHTLNTQTLCGQNVDFSILNFAVSIVTIRLSNVNFVH
jgi:hypothetical protein